MEEIRLANLYYNSDRNYSVWDHVLYGLAREQANLDLIMSCSVCSVTLADPGAHSIGQSVASNTPALANDHCDKLY